MARNKYSSVKFRIMSEEDAKLGPSEEMGEIRLKRNRLSIALINSARKATLKRYTGPKKDQLSADRPTDGDFELYVLSLCCNLLKEYYVHRFRTSVKDDKKLLERKDVKGRLRFAVMHRLEDKEIIINNMHLLELLIQILKKAQTTGGDFRAAYMSKFDRFENDATLYANRRAIRDYLKSYYYYAWKGKN